ncbi:MAG: tetratricopeptide repeat-containing sensor histidine kinase [Flammeovirgaceae bacterium]
MKDLLVILFLGCGLLINSHTFAQSTPLDSLKTLLKQEQTPEHRVKLLVDLGELYLRKNIDSVRVILNEAQALSHQGDNPLEQAMVYRLQAQLHLQIGQQDSAFIALDQALAICKSEKVGKLMLEVFEKTLGNYRQLLRGPELSNYFETYLETAQQDTSLFFKGHLALASELNGLHLYKQGKREEGLRAYQIALKNYEATGNFEGMTQILILVGEIYRQQNRLELALSHYHQGLAIVEKLENSEGIGILSKLIAEAYIFQNNLEKGLFYANQSSKHFKEAGNLRGIGLSYGTLTKLYHQKAMYDSALYYAKAAVETDRKIHPNYYMIPQDLSALGKVLIYKKEFKRALTHLKEADEIYKAKASKTGQAVSSKYFAEAYFGLGNLTLANQYAQQTLKWSTELQHKDGVLNSLELLAKINEKQGKFQQALTYHQKYAVLKDSIFNEKQTQRVADLEAKFKYQKEAVKDSIRNAEKEKVLMAELQTAQAINQQKQQALYFTLGGVVLLLGIAGYIYNRYRLINQQKAIIEEQKQQVDHKNQENELLLKEIHHRVKNNLQIISSLLNLQTKSTEDEAALAAMTDGQNRVKAMALIHQGLYQNEDMATIKFREYAEQLFHQLSSIYANGNDVSCQVDAPDIELDIDTAVPLGLILNELVTNAFKYAFTDIEQGKIELALAQDDHSFELTVRDNGKGLPENFNWKKSKSIGLRLVRRLSKQLYGSFSYEFQDGAYFSIKFQDTWARKQVA